ncbi:MAG: ribonuclease HII [Bdellovibrionales bacterium]|nr:ribonuclease HII [Bdellovibrionales bacterium]
MINIDYWKEKLPYPHIGVDEVGRGCLAGPVCAGAVILNHNNTNYTDSKLLNARERERLSQDIYKNHQAVVSFSSVEEIDQMNILQASLLAMKRAVLALNVSSGGVFVDGKDAIPDLDHFVQKPVIKGDLLVNSISAASIVAKHFRDQWMIRLSKEYPGYGLDQHKGYPTKVHKTAIQKLGLSLIHRKTFKFS